MKLGKLRNILKDYDDNIDIFVEGENFYCIQDDFTILNISTKIDSHIKCGIYLSSSLMEEKEEVEYFKNKYKCNIILLESNLK